eukprot:scaffold2485_cov143-Skeletonema_dohrnii-CCMP3373.AAC.3
MYWPGALRESSLLLLLLWYCKFGTQMYVTMTSLVQVPVTLLTVELGLNEEDHSISGQQRYVELAKNSRAQRQRCSLGA